MKVICALIVFSNLLWYSVQDLNRVREEYTAAAESRSVAEKNIAYLEGFKSDPLASGYRGAYSMIMAKHVFNPISKLKWFNSGKHILEEAITAAPNDTELRYLRLSVQINAPGILNYSDNIKADSQHLITNFDNLKSPVVRTNAAALLKKSAGTGK
jgi:hypothetical protein